MERWRNWNERVSYYCFSSLFGEDDDAKAAFKWFPWAWWFLLIPIAGISGFFGVVASYRLQRRREELDERERKLNEAKAVHRSLGSN